jgi:uncharacterized protein with HEPN domain
MRRDSERLLDILEAIDRIQQKVPRTRAEFDSDEVLQIWVIHFLQIIGEAASRLSERLQAQHSDIPWKKIAGMRHILVHDYFEIDLDIVWATIDQDLPLLQAQIKAALDDLGEDH